MERQSIIEQLVLITGYNRSVYQHYTEKELKLELLRLMGERD